MTKRKPSRIPQLELPGEGDWIAFPFAISKAVVTPFCVVSIEEVLAIMMERSERETRK